jgi:hypothetical protein
VLVAADLGRAVLFGSIPVAAWFGVLTLTQLYVVLALAGLLTVLFDVAHSSYPPRLLAPEQLLPGNAKLAANHPVAAIAGAGAAGILVQWIRCCGRLTATAVGLRPTLLLSGAATLLGTTWLLASPYRTLRTIPTPADSH